MADFTSLYDAALDYELTEEELSPLCAELAEIDAAHTDQAEIARGGMKVISRVFCTRTQRNVAKATLIDNTDPDMRDAFVREARLTALLEHPNIIKVYDIGLDEGGDPFFTMELKIGMSLAALVTGKIECKSRGDSEEHDHVPQMGNSTSPLHNSPTINNLNSLLEIYLKICDAISYAHSRNILHLDLKPENIQVGSYGEVIVCDWGLGKVIDSAEYIPETKELAADMLNNCTLYGTIKGTPGFMAPEQLEGGEKVEQTDIYALGAILFSILAPNRLDFLSQDQILKQTNEGVTVGFSQRNLHIPSSLRAVISKAMQKNPADRYQTVEELRHEIAQYLTGYPTDAQGAGFLQQLAFFWKRNKVVCSVITLFSGIFIIGLSLFFNNVNKEKNKALWAEQQVLLAYEQLQHSEATARAAERDANSNLQELMRITAERNEVAKVASPSFLDKARHNLVTLDYDMALENTQHSFTLDPDFYIAHFFYGVLLTGLFEFEEAQKHFSLGIPETNPSTIETLEVLAHRFKGQTNMDVPDIIEIMEVLQNSGQPYDILHSVVYSPKLNHWTTEQRRELAIAGFKIFLKDSLPPVFTGDSVSNVWRTPNRNLLHLLYKTGIKEFNFSYSTWTNLPMIKGDVTRKVYVGNFPPDYFIEALKQCPNLEEIVIAESYNHPRFLSGIPQHLKISTYSPEVSNRIE